MKKQLFILLLLVVAVSSFAQTRKVQHRPYIDQRRIHYGFLVGMHVQDLEFINNGFITEEGQTWFADIAEYSPGFSVGVLAEYYLHEHLALRAIPTLHFGDKTVIFREQESGERHRQSMKSVYIALPINIKFAAERFNNYRPYIVGGVSPILDLGQKRQKALKLKTFDCYMELGVGCDFYLPFFKLIPELKFSFGLANLLEKDRKDLTDKSLYKFTQSLDGVSSKMITFTLYFE